MLLLRRTALVLCCVLSVGCSCPAGFAQSPAQTKVAEAAIHEAEQASEAWLGMMDAGQYGDCWKAAAAVVRSAVTEEKWTATMKNVREPLGKVVTRKVQSATHTGMLPGVPDGDYVMILYETSFEHKQTAQETVVMSREKDNVWRVAGFYIK
jgi:hypothetical protein